MKDAVEFRRSVPGGVKIYLLILVALALLCLFYLLRGKLRNASNFLYVKKAGPHFPAGLYKVREKINYHAATEGVVSVSLFGSPLEEKYLGPLLKNEPFIPPNWSFRVYLCPTAGEELVRRLVERDFEVYVVEEPSYGLSGALWRFLPMADGEQFVSLDADELGISDKLFSPEVYRQWKESGKPFVIFPNSWFRNPVSPIIGGKFGSKIKHPSLVRSMEKYDNRRYGGDEVFLREEIFPLAQREGYLEIGNRLTVGALLTAASVAAILVLINYTPTNK